MKKTLIINYFCMQIGGIECYFAELMRYAVSQKYRVIWFTTKKHMEIADFKDIVNDYRIEKIFVGQGIHIFDEIDISFNKHENIIMLSCEPMAFVIAEKLKSKFKGNSFSNFLLLPHFTGNAYYPERFFKKVLMDKLFFKIFQDMANKIVNNNALLAFSEKHLLTYEKIYKVKISEKANKVLKPIFLNKPILSEVELEEKAKNRKKKFEIITCARFDFPHKGYIVGLIKAFNNLKKCYPQLTLTIVGYGEGERYLKEIIDKLPKDSKDSIKLLGKLLPQELQKAFRNSTLNIGLAGALIVGARCALPSISVRHYTYDCECYGFYEDSLDYSLSTKPGENIEFYIRQLINCSDEEYVLHGISAYDKANNSKNVDPEYIFKQYNISNESIFSKLDILKFKFINFMICIMIKFFKLKSYDDANGT